MKVKALIRNSDRVILSNMSIERRRPEEVLLSVATVGLCRTDLLVASGTIKATLPEIVLGHEFSAQVVEDPIGIFQPGEWVSYNPLLKGLFMGVDFNGAICTQLYVNRENLVRARAQMKPEIIAYVEPVAASMAVLKAMPDKEKCASLRIGIVGDNRIATLTKVILGSYGIQTESLSKDMSQCGQDTYDILIETVFEESVLKKMVEMLKPEGLLIIKSRKKTGVGIISNDLVVKELSLKAVNYYSFEEAMSWLSKNESLVLPLLGKTFPLGAWEAAFNEASTGEFLKTFIDLRGV